MTITLRLEKDEPLTFDEVDGNFTDLDTTKADVGHTHVPTEIVGSTAAGRAMLTAANATAQTALLDTATTSLKGLLSSADKTKLDAITGTNTGDETASGVLTKIKTVDGDGSGLDADKLDGLDATAFALASHTQASSTISDSTAAGRSLLTAPTIVSARSLMGLKEFNVAVYGAVGGNTTLDTAGFLAAIAAAKAAGKGRIVVPASASAYRLSSTLQLDFNNFQFEGEAKTGVTLDFSYGATGNGIEIGNCFDWKVENITVTNAAADAFSIGIKSIGPQSYSAWCEIENCASNISAGRGFAFGNVYMSKISGLRAQSPTGYGFEFGAALQAGGIGFHTSLLVHNCHVMDGATDGWKLKNITYSQFTAIGADRSGGYAYNLQDLHGVKMSGIGAEDSQQSMLYFYYDPASSSIVKGFKGFSIDTAFEKTNNVSAGSNGSFAHFNATTGSGAAGTVEIVNATEYSTPASYSMRMQAGNYKLIMPRSRNNITPSVNGGSFVVVGDGSDTLNGLPVTISGATAIATLGPKLANGVNSFGGRLTVYVTQNSLASAARSATYELLVTRAVGTSEIKLISSAGNTTGANSADCSFTFSFNPADNKLSATPVGSTANGSYYFHLSASGNIAVYPL